MISVSGAAANSSGASELRSWSAAATNCTGTHNSGVNCRGIHMQDTYDQGAACSRCNNGAYDINYHYQ